MRELLSLWTALALAFQPFLGTVAMANPEGAEVVNGEVDISGTPDYMVIEASDGSIIEYTGFDIGAGETVQFVQPNELAAVLNRVNAAHPSQIDGALLANGQVYIVNPAGVIFGENAAVDVVSLIAAAGDISNEDFLAGNDHFTGLEGVVENYGHIQADMAAFLGAHVANHGIIDAPDGLVMMVAGDAVLLGRPGTGYIKLDAANVKIDGKPAVENTGTIDAGEGHVVLAAGDYYSLAIRHTGTTRAQTIVAEGGAGGVVEVAGTLDASNTDAGGVGGSIDVLGDKVAVHDALLDASGDAGGGSIRVGGDFQGGGDVKTASQTYVGSDATLRADAISDGDGGTVIVWSEQATQFFGDVSARGGAEGGDGGFAEISGDLLAYDGGVDLRAPEGHNGTVLFDPKNITIADMGTAVDPGVNTAFANLPADDVTFSDESVEALLDGNNVVLQANNDLSVDQAIDVVDAGNTENGALTLNAGRNLSVNQSIVLMGSFTGTANDPNADPANRDGVGPGIFTLGAAAAIDTTNVLADDGNPGTADVGDISITADDFVILAGGSISADDGSDVTLAPSSGVAVDVGDAAADPARFQVSQAEIDAITVADPGTLTVGSATAGAILVADNVQAVDRNLALVTGANVTDIDDSGANLTTTGSLAVQAETGIELDTAVTSLEAATNTGSIDIANSGAFVVAGAGVSVAGGTGSITLAALGDQVGDNLNLVADVTATGGDINLFAGDTINVVPPVTVSTTGSGAVNLGAGLDSSSGAPVVVDGSDGAVLLSDGSTVSSGSGQITLTAPGDVQVSRLSTTGVVEIIANADLTPANPDSGSVVGAITDAGDTGGADVQALRLLARSGDGIDLDTEVDFVQAATESGSIDIANTGSLTIGGPIPNLGVQILDTAGDDGNGSISVTSTDTLIVNQDVLNNSAGTITLGAADGITVGATVSTDNATAAAVSVDADTNDDAVGIFTLQTDGSIDTNNATATDGDVTVVADDFVIDARPDTGIDAGTGNVTLRPSTAIGVGVGAGAGDFSVSNDEIADINVGGTLTIGDNALASLITLDDVQAGSRNVALETMGGIVDADDTNTNFTSTGSLTLTSDLAIGSGNAQGLNVDVASVDVTDTNGTDVTITDAGTSDTTWDVATGGAGTVTVVQQQNALAVGAISTTGDVSLTAVGEMGVGGALGSITDAANDPAVDVTGDNLTMAAAGSIGASGASLDTSVNSLAASSTVDGDIFVSQSGTDLVLGLVETAGSDFVIEVDSANLTVGAAGVSTADETMDNATSGLIRLATIGSGGNITVNGAVKTGDSTGMNGTSGSATIEAGGSGAVFGTGSVATGAAETTGMVVLSGDRVSADQGGTGLFDVVTPAGATGTGGLMVTTDGGAAAAGGVYVEAASGDLALAAVTANAGTGTVTLASPGAIVDAAGAANTVADVTGGALTLMAGAPGIGQDAAGAVDVASTSLTASTTGDGAISIDGVDGSGLGLVTVNAGAGAVVLNADGAITDAGAVPAATNVTAGTAALTAGTGIGQDANPIETDVDNVEASSTTGPIAIADVDGLTIGGVAGGPGGVSTDGNVTLRAGEGLLQVDEPVAAGTGTVTLEANDGINVAAAVSTDNDTANAVSIDADLDAGDLDGTLTIAVTGSIDTNNASATDGDVTVVADDFVIDARPDAGIDAGTGNVTLRPSTAIGVGVGAGAGDFSVSNDEIADITVGGTLTIGDNALASLITLDDVQAGSRNVALETMGGIVDADDTNTNFTSLGSLTLTSDLAIGSGNAQGLNVDVASVNVTDTNGTDVTMTDAGTSDTTWDVATGGAGMVTLTQQQNDLAVGAISTTAGVSLTATGQAGVGGAIFDASAANTDVDVSGGVVSLIANQGGIGQSNGALDVAVATSLTATTSADGGNVSIESPGSLPVDQIDTGVGTVLLTSGGAVTEVDPLATEVIASGLGVSAQAGVTLDTQVANLEAETETGSIQLANTRPAGLTIGGVDPTLTGVRILDAGMNDNGGSISVTSGSPLTVNESVSNADGGDITLAALGTADTDDLTVDAAVSATGGNGNITLFAGDTITVQSVNGTGSVSAAGAGGVALFAGTDFTGNTPAPGNIEGDVVLTDVALATDPARVSADTGTIGLQAPDDVQVTAVSSNGTVIVTADVDLNGDGAISDSGDTQTDIAADVAFLTAPGGIGASDAIEVDIATSIDADASASAAAADTVTVALTAVNGNLPVALIQGAAGDVVLESENGAITDADADMTDDVVAGGLALRAQSGVDLDTAVSRLAALTDQGTIEVANSGALTIGSVQGLAGVTVADAGDLNNGGEIQVTASSPLTVDEAVVNNDGSSITLAALGTAVTDTLDVNAAVTTTGGSGAINLYAGGTITVSGTSDPSGAVTVSAANAGAVNVLAGTDFTNGSTSDAGNAAGAVALNDGSVVSSGSGTITLRAPADVQVSRLSTTGNAVIMADFDASGAGAIADAGATGGADVEAATLAAQAGSGIDLDTAVTNLEAETESGDIDIANDGALTIGGVGGLGASLSGVRIIDTADANGGGTILVTASSPLTVDESVVNNDGGMATDPAITLAALGATAGDDLTVNAAVMATGGDGDVALRAGDTVTVSASGSVSAVGAGAAILLAGTDFTSGSAAPGNADGDVVLMDGSTVTSDTGTIVLQAPDDVQVTGVVSNGQVRVIADSDGSGDGAITDSGDTLTDIVADEAALFAPDGIGTDLSEATPTVDPLEVEITTGILAAPTPAIDPATAFPAAAGEATVALTAVNDTDLPVDLILGGAGDVVLRSTGGAITDIGGDESSADVIAGGLSAVSTAAAGPVDAIDLDTAVQTVAASATNGNIILDNLPFVSAGPPVPADLVIGTVQGLSGITAQNGGVSVDASVVLNSIPVGTTATLDVLQPVAATNGDVVLTATDDIVVDAPVTTNESVRIDAGDDVDADASLTVNAAVTSGNDVANDDIVLEADNLLNINVNLAAGRDLKLDVRNGDPDDGERLILFDTNGDAVDDATLMTAGRDILVNTEVPLTSVPEVATFGKVDGDLTFAAGRDFTTTTNQKLSVGGEAVVLGDRDILIGDVAGVNVTIGDGSTDSLTFLRRSGGRVRQFDGTLALDGGTDTGVDIVGNTIAVVPFSSTGGGAAPFFYTRSGAAPPNASQAQTRSIFLDGSELTQLSFVGEQDGELLDLVGNLTSSPVNQAPSVPDELFNMTGGMLTSLNQVGKKSKPLWESELVSFIACGIIDEEEVEAGEVPPECEDFVAEETTDKRFTELEPAVKAAEVYDRLASQESEMMSALQSAADGYVRSTQAAGRPVSGKGFRAYCLGEPQHRDALDYLNQLGELSANLTELQERVNTQTGDLDEFFEFLVDDVTPNGMSPDELMEAIEMSPPSTASLAAMDLPRSLRRR